MGRTCGGPNDIELTATHELLNGSRCRYPADGWGNERWGWSTKGRFNVYFKAVVWKEFAGKKADFDQKLAMEAGGSKSNTYKELKHNFGEYPDHVLVTAEAQSGPNKGFKFYSRGASVVDDDHNKYYAGLASAYDSTRVRLWYVRRGQRGHGLAVSASAALRCQHWRTWHARVKTDVCRVPTRCAGHRRRKTGTQTATSS